MNSHVPALLLALAASGVLFSTPVMSQEIVVSSQAALQKEVARVSRQLDARLAQQYFPSTSRGFAIVRFTIGADGRPQGVRLQHGSGADDLDRSAMRAVAKLDGLAPLGGKLASGMAVQANIVVAPNPSVRDRLTRQLGAYEAERLARAPKDKVIALTASGARSR